MRADHMQESTPDILSDPIPLAAPIPPEQDPKTSPEPAEPILKKSKIPKLAAPSNLRGAVKTGSPSVVADAIADAVGSSARQLSSGQLLSWPLMLRYTRADHLTPPLALMARHPLCWHHCAAERFFVAVC